jgi:hypothetical protein
VPVPDKAGVPIAPSVDSTVAATQTVASNDTSLTREEPGPSTEQPSTQAVRNSSATTATSSSSREIDRLRTVFLRNRAQLDPRTAAIIEANLKVIDDAIAQSKAALAQDPASRFLNNQLNNALDKKLDLLRTAAQLPSRT